MPATRISVAEYEHTSFENPDPEFVHGELRQRGTPDAFHSRTQGRLSCPLDSPADAPQLDVLLSVRLRLASDLYLVPDVCAFSGMSPCERFPSLPPLVAAEILSEDDHFCTLLSKLRAFAAWSVPHLWVVDPYSRELWIYDCGSLSRVDAFELPGHRVRIATPDLFPLRSGNAVAPPTNQL